MAADDTPQEIAELKEKIEFLEKRIRHLEERDRLTEKAFRVIGLHTNYAEFGVFKGDSMIQAYYSAWKVFDELTGGHWNHSFQDHEGMLDAIRRNWDKLRFFAFDSFQGIPATSGPDKELEIFEEGTYCCSEEDFVENISRYGVPLEKVSIIPGFFEDSCKPEIVEPEGFGNVGVVNIDSDLYESARTVLNFITPYLSPNAVLIFDEWFQYLGSPEYGEQRAFREWRAAHPEWQVTEFQREGAFRMSFILTRKN